MFRLIHEIYEIFYIVSICHNVKESVCEEKQYDEPKDNNKQNRSELCKVLIIQKEVVVRFNQGQH